jgi:hypothetical protein
LLDILFYIFVGKKEQGSEILFEEGDRFGISGFSWNYDVLLKNVTQ